MVYEAIKERAFQKLKAKIKQSVMDNPSKKCKTNIKMFTRNAKKSKKLKKKPKESWRPYIEDIQAESTGKQLI